MFSINNLEYSDLLIFAVLINIIMYLFLYVHRSRQGYSTKLFRQLTAVIGMVGIFEILSWIIAVRGNSALIPFHYAGNMLFFMTNLLPATLGLLYLDYIIFLSVDKNKRRLFVYLIPVYLNIAFIICNFFFDGFLFSVDSENVYHRGIAAYIGNGFTFLFAIAVVISFYSNRQMITGRLTQTILVLTLFPVLGAILQMLFLGMSLAIPAYTLAVFITFLLMERHELQKDPLTLLNSRAQMEGRLQFKLKCREPFTAIMIDVNDFKSINDIHGHNIGDKVLVDVSKILLSHANYEDHVCRFGGDEFFVILESPRDIGCSYIKRIDQTLLHYSADKAYNAALSYGLVYVNDPDAYDAEELIHLTDQLMYKDKVCRRQQDASPHI